MFQNVWGLIRQIDYIEHLKAELDIERKEKIELQELLHRVLKLHLIPKDRTELNELQQTQIPLQNKSRTVRSVLSELQKKSYDEALRQEIETEEKRINELEVNSKKET